MYIQEFSARNLRNLESLQLSPHPRFNVFSGDNGQGKSNLLEAIYLLSTLRSFRTNRIEELIRVGSRAARVEARIIHRQLQRLLAVELSTERTLRKQAHMDGKPIRAPEYVGGVNAVVFVPEDLQLPRGAPGPRRSFLDRAIFHTFPTYLSEVRTYERVLRSRNALLRSAQGGSMPVDLLDVYDEQLSHAGAVLLRRRRAYVDALSPRVAEVFAGITRTGVTVSLRYRTGGEAPHAEGTEGDLEGWLRERLARGRSRDLLKGYTHTGPHADDLEFHMDERLAAAHASQGQLRALILSTKIAEIRHLREVLGDPPVLLLDDVSSELDEARNRNLFEFIAEMSCQTFITTTDSAHILLPGSERQDFRVSNGSLSAV